MAFRDLFNKLFPKSPPSEDVYKKISDTQLLHCTKVESFFSDLDVHETYDFLKKERFTANIYQGIVASTTTPFSEIEAKTITQMRKKLISLGGHPPRKTSRKKAPDGKKPGL